MTSNPERPPAPLPVPLPPEPPASGESMLRRLLRQRFLLVALVILVFLGGLFGWESHRRVQGPPKSHPPEAAIPHGETPPAPAKLKEPEPVKHAEAAKEAAPPAHPAPPAPVAPPRPVVKGEAFTRALIQIMDDQVNKTWFGWRPNTIIFGKLGLTDNVNNVQLGVLEVARRTVVVLNEHMTRFATTEAYNPQVNEAMNFFMVSSDKYWFPSASGKYREAIHDLELYINALGRGQSRFYGRVDNLIALLLNYKDLLGSSFHHLIKDTEADGKSVSWWVVDDYFYFSKGIALGMSQMLEAVKEDFHQELQKKNCHKLLDDGIHALHAASHLSPWVVTNGGKDGILANHRANMATYIGEAEHVIATLQTVLATN
ncbi:MAG: DUF2333 family protein [Desulfobaccales bacterium]|nr:DUF2333 family protein [Desulfobaccales bacterium]